ncbi:major facilitator superfamily domain-containing protein [Colletotrichum navitas]|uniref:Major facilitator superfamily domain-containing protein n=1 Tax=Colletotrichum navitas TaxID=681940 RepID=A0AAD8V695_9PEZI|nr:major facilitator superfamily domain-containing protein [Colletotrichum navitas]KAK1594574.1 major facilitator superfamily domain-containing protein [Colletotrichum navitas]
MSVTAAADEDGGERTPPRSESSPTESKASDTAAVAVQDAEAASQPPDGGHVAWLQVAGSFFLFFNSWGIIGSYGIFQTYYQAHMADDASVDAIAWIGSIQSCLLLLVGVLVGPLYDAGYFRSLTLTGTALVFVGMAATSFATRYWQTLLAQAFCVGLGAGCLYIPSVAIIPQYFSARRALATGIATTGSSFGGVVYPLIVQSLLPRVGFPWAIRVFAFISLATNAFSFAVLRQRGSDAPGKRRRRVMLDLAAYREASFVVLSAAMFFNVFSYTPPIYYLQQYSLAHGLASEGPSGLAYYLVAILNAGSVLGRVFPAWLAGRYGPVNVLLGVCVSVATVTMCWLAVRTGAGSVAFALAYGFTSGGLVSLPPTVVSILVPHLGLHGTWLGMLSTTNAFGSLAGPPIAGVLLEKTGSYLGVQLLSGLGMTAMAMLVFLLRIMRMEKGRTWIM